MSSTDGSATTIYAPTLNGELASVDPASGSAQSYSGMSPLSYLADGDNAPVASPRTSVIIADPTPPDTRARRG
jgi:hypothetical protein